MNKMDKTIVYVEDKPDQPESARIAFEQNYYLEPSYNGVTISFPFEASANLAISIIENYGFKATAITEAEQFSLRMRQLVAEGMVRDAAI